MAAPVLAIRVAANVEELKRNLQEGVVNQIEVVRGQFQRLTNAYDPQVLIQRAQATAAAIQQVGGASMLSADQQARANRVIQDGVDAYGRLGQDAPQHLRKIAGETKQVDTDSSRLMDTVKELALGFAAMFTARAAFNFVKATIDEASALVDLSQQTHITIEEVQHLAGAMSEFGVDADTLAKGLFGLSRRIAKGDDSVSDALAQMGMSLEDVAGLNGEALFIQIEHGLAKLQGSLRDTTASELFGSKLGMAMAGASEGIEDALEKTKKLSDVMSTETAHSLDEFGESIERANRSLGAMAANIEGPVAQGFNVLYDAIGRGASKWDVFVAVVKDFVASNSVTGASTENLTRVLLNLNDTTEANSAATKKATTATKEYTPAVESMAGATKRARDEAELLERVANKQIEQYQKETDTLVAQMWAVNKLAEMKAKHNDEYAAAKAKIQPFIDAMYASARATKEAAEWEQKYRAEQDETAKANDALIASQANIGKKTDDATKSVKDQTDAFRGLGQQITFTGDAIREWLRLQIYASKAQAILSENSLYTTQSQRERVAALGMPTDLATSKSGGSGVGITVNVTVNGGSSARETGQSVQDAILNVFRSGAIQLPSAV